MSSREMTKIAAATWEVFCSLLETEVTSDVHQVFEALLGEVGRLFRICNESGKSQQCDQCEFNDPSMNSARIGGRTGQLSYFKTET